MKTRHWLAAASVIALLAVTGAQAQEHNKFDEHDRQVTRDWYTQHQNHPTRGFRAQDRLAPSWSHVCSRQATRPRPAATRLRGTSDLRHRMPPPPRHYKYLVIGGHVVLVDNHHVVHDVIRFREENRH